MSKPSPPLDPEVRPFHALAAVPPSPSRYRDLLLLLPLIAAVVFVQIFASSLPLTDEWNYTHAISRLHEVDFSTLAGWTDALRVYPATFREHVVAFPFLLYWPIAEWSNFDSRWIIYLSVAAFAVQAWLFRRNLPPSIWWAMPVSLLLFCPSHYMEFLWGWQITLSFSVVFPLAALTLLDGIADELPESAQTRRLAGALVCLLLGTFSSAGGFFGFVCAAVLLALKRLSWRPKLSCLLVVLGTAGWVYFMVMGGAPQSSRFGLREVWYVLTAFGATLWGSPVGLGSFGLDARSAGGLAIATCTFAVGVRAYRQRLLPDLALPLCITLFGWLCMIPIAMARPYLGNWHIQYALPAVCGAYATAVALWQRDRAIFSALPLVGLTALLTSCLYGYYAGFAHFGPSYRDYTRAIEQHVVRNLAEPGQPPPYPPQGSRDLDAHLLLFLAAHEHPLLADPVAQATLGLPAGALVFLDEKAVAAPWKLTIGTTPTTLLTVVVPAAAAPQCLRLSIGDTSLLLRRVNPLHVPSTVPRPPGATYFMGMLIRHRLPPGEHELRFAQIK